MKIQFITHASIESPAALIEYCKNNKLETNCCNAVYEPLPDIDSFDVLIIMGGPQSPLELEKYPYLMQEINLIKETLAIGKKIIGICLGAQLLSISIESTVSKSPAKEVGWFPITLTNHGIDDQHLSSWPKELDVMHWHYDMLVLNQDMQLIASSEGCPNKIFRYKNQAYGFQCHLEFTKQAIIKLISNCREDLLKRKFTGESEDIRSGDFNSLNNYLYKFLDSFLYS